ncbi:hypothetical protein PR003_g25496 [Phytophthora rubi]|uniref:Uncharacterized protein n=2 Tax=Phytophthora rubi TaxID=129364 RepID=A0A6A4CFW5_9STRA|nr:hypothetical protein PR003_g25496 [Phytophthora rubi]
MLRKSSRADSRKTIQTLEEEGEEEVEDDVDGVENQSPQRQLQPPNTTTSNSDTMTVTVVQPVNNVRPHLRLTRRSSSAVERVTLQPPPEEKKNGGDKSLRPRFLQERSATIVHIQPSVIDPSRVPRSKASAFLLGVLAKSKTLAGPGLGEGKRGALEPLRAGVTNTVHYVPSQGAERGIPLRLAGRRNSRHLGRQLSIVSTTDLLEKAVPDGARKRRVSASQEQMAAVLRALQASKQQASQQLDILHSILRFINSNDRDDNGQRPVVKEMVDVGFIPELSSILREFRFNTDVCAMSILAAVAEESSVYAYMMSEFSLEKLLQKNATVHVAGEKVDEEKGEEEEKKTEEKEEDEEESYEDDFDGDDESEGKMMPSRSDNATIASDGELFDMLHDISAQDLGSAATPIEIRAATIIQRRIRGTLARKAYPRPRRSSSSENITQASEKKTPRTISTGKSTKRILHPEGTKRKQIPLSARAPRQLQTEASSRRGNSLRSIPQAASRTSSSRLITPGKEASKTKVPSAGAGVRHPSLATNSHLLSSSRSLRSMGHSAFRLFSSNSSHDIDTGSTEVAKEPPDPKSLKQIQALYAEGLQHQKENHLGLAIECYEKALAIPGGQSFASIHVNIGSALMAKNKFSEALESFRQAKRIQPDNTKAIYNYSLALLHLDRPQEAQQLLRRILELDPNHEKAAIALSHIQGAIL